MIWFSILLILFLLGILKIGVSIRYWDEEFSLKIAVWRFRFSLPAKKESASKKPKKEKKKKSAPKPESAKPEKKKSPKGKLWAQAALARWQELLELVGRVLHLPAIDLLEVRFTAANPDPMDCAILYGRVCAAVGAVMPVLEKNFRFSKREIHVESDFLAEKSVYNCRADITVQVYQVLALAVAALKILLAMYREVKKSEKAVQTNESSSS